MSDKSDKTIDSVDGCLNTVGLIILVVLLIGFVVTLVWKFVPVEAAPIAVGIGLVIFFVSKYYNELKRRLIYPVFIILAVLVVIILLAGIGLIFGIFKHAMFN